MQIDPLFGNDQPAMNRCWRNTEANAQPWRKGLGEGADIDHMIRRKGLDWRQCLTAVTEVAVGIILDDQHTIALDNRRHRLSPVEGQGAAGRVLEGGDKVNVLDRLALQHLF